jgi:hypothetical protein
MLFNELLAALLVLSLIFWVGGAITGQIMLARARVLHDMTFAANLIPMVRWLITTIYIPAAATAFTSGLVLAYLNGISLTTPWLLFLIFVFTATVIMGSVYSLPEYKRLTQMLNERGPHDMELHRRLTLAAWFNRIELCLIVIGLVGITKYLV